MTLATRISALATSVGNYIRDSVKPRLMPSGGTAGQVLSKSSSTDFAAEWTTVSSGSQQVFAGSATPSFQSGVPAFWMKKLPNGNTTLIFYDGV